MQNINQLIQVANRNGFESYGNFNEGDVQHEILTCTKGKYSGEVIDIYYNFYSGSVSKVEISTQFKGQEPKFSFN